MTATNDGRWVDGGPNLTARLVKRYRRDVCTLHYVTALHGIIGPVVKNKLEAVLRASPNLKPCKPKYGRIPYDQFLEHVRKDRCMQCRDFLLQLDKELKMMKYLRQHKN